MQASFKLLSLVAAAALVSGAGVARADYFVTGDTTKTKTITVTKTVNVAKAVAITAVAALTPDGASEQDIVINQSNQHNFAEDEESTASNAITGSFTGASGEQATIQNNGFNNNNLNADSLSYSNAPTGSFVNAEIDLQQVNGIEPPRDENGDVVSTNTEVVYDTIDIDPRGINVFESIDGNTYSNGISGSFNNGAGVAKTIQENGSNNNNTNAVAIALGDHAIFALDEVDVGQFSNHNFANVRGLNRGNGIENSFQGYNGLTATIQDNGSNNNNANTSAIAASTTAPPSPGNIPVGGLGGINND